MDSLTSRFHSLVSRSPLRLPRTSMAKPSGRFGIGSSSRMIPPCRKLYRGLVRTINLISLWSARVSVCYGAPSSARRRYSVVIPPVSTKLMRQMQSEERLPMKFSKLVEFVSKKPIPPHTKHLVVEVMVSDQDGEDVEVC